jgi:hypothetical protein
VLLGQLPDDLHSRYRLAIWSITHADIVAVRIKPCGGKDHSYSTHLAVHLFPDLVGSFIFVYQSEYFPESVQRALALDTGKTSSIFPASQIE